MDATGELTGAGRRLLTARWCALVPADCWFTTVRVGRGALESPWLVPTAAFLTQLRAYRAGFAVSLGAACVGRGSGSWISGSWISGSWISGVLNSRGCARRFVRGLGASPHEREETNQTKSCDFHDVALSVVLLLSLAVLLQRVGNVQPQILVWMEHFFHGAPAPNLSMWTPTCFGSPWKSICPG